MKKVIALAVLATAVLAASAAAGVAALSGTITADGSSTVGPYAIAAAEGFQKRNPEARVTVGISGTGGGFERFCRNETDLSNASRPMRNSEAILLPRRRRQVDRVHGRQRRALGRRQQAEHVGQLPHDRRAEDDLGRRARKVDNWKDVRAELPGRAAEALRPRHRLGHVRLLHRGDQRPAQAEPLRLPRDRGRQRASSRASQGERGGARLLRLLLLRGEQADKLKVARDRRGQGGLRRAERRDGAERHVQAALAAALHLREAELVQAAGGAPRFIGYIFNNEKAIAKQAGFIALTDRQLKKARYQYLQALKSNNT